jgi:hypothetical protein
MSGADVRSIQALEDLKGALGHFGGEAQEALGGAQREIQRVLEWLGQRQQHWQTELRRRTEAAGIAAAALARCQASGSYDSEGRYYPPNCTAYEAALAQARGRLREAEVELRKVQQWTREMQRAVGEYQRQVVRLSALLSGELPLASALLGRKIASLQGYAAMSGPARRWSPTVGGLRSGARMSRSWTDMAPSGGGGDGRSPLGGVGATEDLAIPDLPGGSTGVDIRTPAAGGTEDVSVGRIDISDTYVHDMADFEKVSHDEMVEGFRKLEEVVRPAVRQGAGGDYFSQLDAERGLDYPHGFRRIYDAFYGNDAIRLERVGDTYQVMNGYHRLFVAKELRLESVPARVIVPE